jgi:hypothetical protein
MHGGRELTLLYWLEKVILFLLKERIEHKDFRSCY